MRISVFGIGYVGAVTSACLARDGHQVVAVDTNASKVDLINRQLSPIVEPGLDELIREAGGRGRLVATTSVAEAIACTDLSFICVGTPSLMNGNLDVGFVTRVCEDIGAELRTKKDFHSVIVRSTLLPGTMEGTVIPVLERSSKRRAHRDFGVAFYPEFLRESTAIADYDEPSVIVFAAKDEGTIDRVRKINRLIKAPEVVTDYATAEAVKYANNAWHAVKIVFANEIGRVSKALNIDGHEVMRVLCLDQKLNLSAAYLRPGFAFGGSCLPKDLRALQYRARSLDVAVPLLEATARSNALQVDRALEMVLAHGRRRVGMLGLSFKARTDDLRESPLVEMAERLYGKGFDLRIFDPNVQYSALMGANLHFVRARLPHLSALMVERPEAVVAHADTLVIGTDESQYRDLVQRPRDGQRVIDLVRIDRSLRSNGDYEGICW